MKAQLFPLKQILTDTRFQFRKTSLGKNLAELKRLMADGIELDPVTLWKQPDGYLILDGFQRVEAAREILGESGSIKAKIAGFPENDSKSAFLHAIEANQKHGGQLERADRANMAKELLKEFPGFSNVQIAKRCGLKESTVRGYRVEMPEAQSDTRLGADGRVISVPKKAKKANEPLCKGEAMSKDKLNSADAQKETDSSEQEMSQDEETSPPEHNNDCTAEAVRPLPFNVHAELVGIGINPHEVSGQLGDFIEELEQLQDYVEGLSLRSEVTEEDVEQVVAIHEAVARLHDWRKLAFVTEETELVLRA